MYINAKKFFVDFYVSGKDVIQMEDKEAGVVIGKGNLVLSYKANFMFTYKTRVSHLIKISIKDGKYKYEITDFMYDVVLPPGNHVNNGKDNGLLEDFPKHNREMFYNDFQNEIKKEIAQIKIYMAKKQSTDF